MQISFVLSLVSAFGRAGDPYPYDHQTVTYTTSHKAVTVAGEVTITPVFSPEYSASTLTALIQSADVSIDIGSPGFSSWDACTPFVNVSECMAACTPASQRNESFPIFAALVNALNRGVKVRILTNDYETHDCTGTISPLNFLALNGAQIGFYTSTTFIHAKYCSIDGKKTAISSINYSKTSFRYNREAGGIVEGKDAQPLIDMMAQVYEADFAQSDRMEANETGFTAMDLAIIKGKDVLPVRLPPANPSQADYYSPPSPSPITATGKFTASTSPDYAALEVEALLRGAQTSLDIMVYQVTDDAIADSILDRWRSGVNVHLLVSSSVFDHSDCVEANRVYTKLYNETMTAIAQGAAPATFSLLKTTTHYTYSHQKFWIADGVRMAWSTGNLSPSDYPAQTDSVAAQKFPVYGADGWFKSNRDFTIYVEENPKLVKAFLDVLNGDSDPAGTFPSKVFAWEPAYPIKCGTGVH